MDFTGVISTAFRSAFKEVFDIDLSDNEILISQTKKDFEGDYTIVLFPFVKVAKANPAVLGESIGNRLLAKLDFVENYNVVSGFLNLEMKTQFWLDQLHQINNNSSFGFYPKNGKKVMVEFASPNTNKPLHLGHIRNILLGWSMSKIFEANGYDVIRTQIINDRGIAICKSMLAWLKYGNNESPESTGIKSDHFVGKYYVEFENKFQQEYKLWQSGEIAQGLVVKSRDSGISNEEFFKTYKNHYFNEFSILGKEAREMLQKWEAGDDETIALWNKMNQWVYEGFEASYKKMSVWFDKNYYESNTYLLGKEAVAEGLNRKVFEKEADGSVWIDLTDAGMDRKIVLRSDGTAVYMTQDIGTAMLRYKDFGVDHMIYTVADEQDYHFKVLFEILKRLKEPYAEGLHHLSYGMVDLPTGKMKSREGTVVDADDLIDEVINEARESSQERGEIAGLTEKEQNSIFEKIGFAALKFFILKVQAKKRMTFDPKESLDMQGQTGPYIQNAYVRTKAVFRKRGHDDLPKITSVSHVEEVEKEILKMLLSYPQVVAEACRSYDPSNIANFCYALAKEYHRFWHEVKILGAASETERDFRLLLSKTTGDTISKGMALLGIDMVDRM